MDEEPGSSMNISVTWRGNKYVVGIDSNASLKDLGDELQKLTGVNADTMKLFVPQGSSKSSNMLSPFADDHSRLSLHEASITEGKSLRMMGVPLDEVDKIRQYANMDMRIAGFKEEEKRLMQRVLARTQALKLPPGPYIFCDFQPLKVQFEIKPPPGNALRLMHMLASDPGIVAVMNKHRWRVGLLSEMAPIGLVGISPKCILGLNKNQGEEISLRLRTDNCIGFRKYASIKKTLLHELAHMVYAEHDANFYALDKQLNEEVNALDWTKSRGQTLAGINYFHDMEEEYDDIDATSFSQKLGGSVSSQLASARASSVSAAYQRMANASTKSEELEEPEPDDSRSTKQSKPDPMDVVTNSMDKVPRRNQVKADDEPDPDEHSCVLYKHELDRDDSQTGKLTKIFFYPSRRSHQLLNTPDVVVERGDKLGEKRIKELVRLCEKIAKPDPDDAHGNKVEPDPDDGLQNDDPGVEQAKPESYQDSVSSPISTMQVDEPDPDDSLPSDDPGVVQAKPKSCQDLVSSQISSTQMDEPDPDDEELRRIQDPVTSACERLRRAMEILKAELNSTELEAVLQTLLRIIRYPEFRSLWNRQLNACEGLHFPVQLDFATCHYVRHLLLKHSTNLFSPYGRNIIEHPDEVKYKRLKKANPIIQRNVANFKAAMEILQMIGFSEDVVFDQIGNSNTYLVLKRKDPGLLWLAKSSLEAYV